MTHKTAQNSVLHWFSGCRGVPAEELVAAKLRVPSFHQDFGPSFDGVTVKNNFADIKGRRSFGTRYVRMTLSLS